MKTVDFSETIAASDLKILSYVEHEKSFTTLAPDLITHILSLCLEAGFPLEKICILGYSTTNKQHI